MGKSKTQPYLRLVSQFTLSCSNSGRENRELTSSRFKLERVIVKLGAKGSVEGVDIDTGHFAGNE